MPEAEAQADKILQQAESKKQARINEANSQVARFNAMYDQYIQNPEITRQRMFYEAMEDVLPDLKVIINGSGDSVNTILPLEPFSSTNVTQETQAPSAVQETQAPEETTSETESADEG